MDDAMPSTPAARIAVLVARSNVVRRGGPAPTTYSLGESSAQPAEEVARQLASLPKPVYLRAELREKHIALQAEALAAHPERAALHERVTRRRSQEPPLAFLAGRFGEDIDREQIGVTCHGAGELIQVTVEAFGIWQRDYHHETYGYGADFVDSHVPAAQGVELGEFQGPGFVNFGWAEDGGGVVIHWDAE
jgi:hypothetical protein